MRILAFLAVPLLIVLAASREHDAPRLLPLDAARVPLDQVPPDVVRYWTADPSTS